MIDNVRRGVRQGSASAGRSRCRLVFAPEFEASARKRHGLGATPELRLASATAGAGAFFDQWKSKSSVSDVDLRKGRWKFKPLQGHRARGAKLQQIYLEGMHRAALVIEEASEPCAVRFLLVYHKREQDRAIERAVEIVEKVGEGRR
jgi:hypothetical protein